MLNNRRLHFVSLYGKYRLQNCIPKIRFGFCTSENFCLPFSLF